MISGRKKRFELKPGIYCGQTTPMVRMSVIVSRRTRVNHSSHSLVAKLLSIVRPRLHPGIRASGHPQVQAGKVEDRECLLCPPEQNNAHPGENRLLAS